MPAALSSPALPDEATWARWGIEPSWSRQLDVTDRDGTSRRWHVLDTGSPTIDAPAGTLPGRTATIVCVHGNPTWAYAWKTLLARFAGRHRVIAIDQLSMGYSERAAPRRYAQRIIDLDDIIGALDIDPASPWCSPRTTGAAPSPWGGRSTTPIG